MSGLGVGSVFRFFVFRGKGLTESGMFCFMMKAAQAYDQNRIDREIHHEDMKSAKDVY